MGRREREGAQARAYGEGGQAGGRGQEQGAGRSGVSGQGVRASWQEGQVEKAPYGPSEVGRCTRMRAARWDSAEQKLKLICFYFIQLQLSINILL